MVAGTKARRGPQKRADYLLQYTRDFTLAVVEAKAAYKSPGTGLQQAKDYAEILGLKFAYATNGEGIVVPAKRANVRRFWRISATFPYQSPIPCLVREGCYFSAGRDSTEPAALLLRSVERVEQTHAGSRDIGRVAGDEGHVPDLRSRRHKAVNYRDGIRHVHASPFFGCLGVNGQNPVSVIAENGDEPGLVDVGLHGISSRE